MKRALILFVLIALFQSSFGQQPLYELWKEAGKRLDSKQLTCVTYDNKHVYLEVDEWKLNGLIFSPKREAEYKFIGEELVRNGFKYDPKNDTLVFMFYRKDSRVDFINAFSGSTKLRVHVKRPELILVEADDKYYYDKRRDADRAVFERDSITLEG